MAKHIHIHIGRKAKDRKVKDQGRRVMGWFQNKSRKQFNFSGSEDDFIKKVKSEYPNAYITKSVNGIEADVFGDLVGKAKAV